jgi:hypothetical protein
MEGKSELIEFIRLVDDQFGLINKLLQSIPLFGRRTPGGECGNGWLDGVLSVEHFRRTDFKHVIGDNEPVRGVCHLIGYAR